MRRLPLTLAALGLVALAACGDPSAPARTLTVRQALQSDSELVELEAASVRQDLFRDVARRSAAEAGRETSEPVLFPVIQNGRLTAAPALDARADLFTAADVAAMPLHISFDGPDLWPEDRRDALGGLSEREAAELVARSLLSYWNVDAVGAIVVERAVGAPYAAAYVDGILRVNPSFLYMAASVGPSSVPSSLQ